MNSYGLVGGLLIMAGLGSWAVWERGTAEHWHSQFVSLQASYSQAADKARADALAQEAKDKAALETQSSKAIQQAQSQAQQAQNQLKSYQAKLAAAATVKDLGHRCAGVEIPKDLIP